MSTTEFDLDSFLSDSSTDGISIGGLESRGADGNVIPFKEHGYEGNIDYRIRQLSYSSLLTLHQCPRRFELYRLRTTHRTEESEKSTITFAFGHVVGEGIQEILKGSTEEQVIWKMFLGWHTDLAASDDKSKKNFYSAVFAVRKFIQLREAGFLEDYELVYIDDIPACELSFCIDLPDGFRLRGFVDAVLKHKPTGRIIVLECKTTGLTTLNPASYKNSAQAIGYSVVLDHMFPDLSSYDVLYLVYQTGQREYTPITFTKTFLQRALWIRELLLDIDIVKMYAEAEVFPMRGESCTSFGRDCEYLQTCGLSTSYLTKPCTPQEEDTTEYQIKLTLHDLLESQFRKTDTEHDPEI